MSEIGFQIGWPSYFLAILFSIMIVMARYLSKLLNGTRAYKKYKNTPMYKVIVLWEKAPIAYWVIFQASIGFVAGGLIYGTNPNFCGGLEMGADICIKIADFFDYS